MSLVISDVRDLQSILKLFRQQSTLTEIFQVGRKGENKKYVTDTVNQIDLICSTSLGQEAEKQENMTYFIGGINLRDLKFQQSEKGPSKEDGRKAS